MAMPPVPSWIDEFKAFIMRGNVIDLAVAVVIGAAFGTVVTSFVSNIINKFIAKFNGREIMRDGVPYCRACAGGAYFVR